MEFRILGPLQVLDDGREVPVGPAKERAVLGVLLLHAGSVVSRAQLIDGLWGENPPPTATKALNVYVSRVRKALSRNGAEPIVTRPPGYILTPGADTLDAARFERLASVARDRARTGELEAAAAVMQEALGLWRGPALAGVELEGEGRDDVARLEELRLVARLDLVDYELALGRHEQLAPELERLVAQHPLDERLRGQLILALYRSGRQTEALQAYRDTRETLVEMLGLEPSAPLQRMERAILNQDPALEAAPGSARPVPEARGSRGRRRRWHAAVLIGGAGAAALLAAAAHRMLADTARPLRLSPVTVGLIDGGRGNVRSELSLPSRPVGLAIGDQSVWITTGSGALLRADVEHPGGVPSFVSRGHLGPVAAAAGSVWALDPDRGIVERIDPATARILRTTRVGNGPTAIAAGLGSVWVANGVDGTLARIDAATGDLQGTIAVGSDPAGVAVGGGSVWVSDAGGTVLRVQPEDNRVAASIAVGSAPGALAVGAGSVWVANRDDGTISRIDPASNRVRAAIPIGHSADGVAAAGESVWAISAADDSVSRIDLAANRVARTSRLGSAPVLIASNGRQLAVATGVSAVAHRGGTLRLRGNGEDATVDPATWWNYTGWGVLAVTNDGLLTVRRTGGPSGLEIVPDLARAAPLVGEAGRTYTFQLRSGTRYSTGRLVRARDVRASIERLWKLHSAATTVPDLRLGLVGEAACARTPRRCDLSRGIAIDDASGTIVFRLTRPNPVFERLLTMPFYDVLPAGTRARDGRPLPATGPYRIARYVPGRLIEAERNERFHTWSTAAHPPGYPDRITWRLDGGDARALADVRAGQADYAVLEEPQRPVAADSELGRVQVHNEPDQTFLYASLNTRLPPFDSADARRAINFAVDRRIVARLAGGPLAARPTCQILPPAFPGYRPWCPYTFGPSPSGSWSAPDLEAARALVRRSGTLGSKVVLWTKKDPSQPERLTIGRYLTGLLRTLGYHATMRTLGPDRYYSYVADSRHRAQIGIVLWIPDTLDSSTLFEQLLTCSSYAQDSAANENFAGYCNRRTDAEIRHAEAVELMAPGATNALWSRIDRRIGRAAPWVPLYTVRRNNVLSARVGNYEYNPMLGFLLDQAWVK